MPPLFRVSITAFFIGMATMANLLSPSFDGRLETASRMGGTYPSIGKGTVLLIPLFKMSPEQDHAPEDDDPMFMPRAPFMREPEFASPLAF